MAGSAGYSRAGVHMGRYWLVAAMAVSLGRSQMLTQDDHDGQGEAEQACTERGEVRPCGPRRNPRLYMARARAAPRVTRTSHPPVTAVCAAWARSSAPPRAACRPTPSHATRVTGLGIVTGVCSWG